MHMHHACIYIYTIHIYMYTRYLYIYTDIYICGEDAKMGHTYTYTIALTKWEFKEKAFTKLTG